MRPSIRALLALALPLLATACNTPGPGPRAVVVERGAFNEAIQRTNAEQLLLNIVRLRYVDTPMFLELSSIASQVEVEISGGLDATLREGADDQLGLGAGITTTRAPTISYTPLQGEQFVRQLLTPLDVRTIVLLYHSGWSVDRLLRLSVQSLGPLRNAPRASGPTPSTPPMYADFLDIVLLLRTLQRQGRLQLAETTTPVLGGAAIVIEVDLPREGEPDDPARLIRERLDLPLDKEQVILETSLVQAEDQYTIVPRSLMAMLFYAAQAVDVPDSESDAGLVTVTRDAEGNLFDWDSLFEGLFEVHVSETPPAGAYVDVLYRGHWFYIADDDLDSKATFALLDQLFALQAGTRQSNAPVLTIPVGG